MMMLGKVLFLIVLIGLPWLLLAKVIDLGVFGAIGVFGLLGSFALIVGPESITEFTMGKISIKRDVKAARELRDEVAQVREELRDVTKLIVEDAYIVASSSFLAMGAEGAARERLESNLEQLSKFAEPLKEQEDEWWEELQRLFASRQHDVPPTPPNA